MLSKKGVIIIVAGIIGLLLCCGVTSCVTGIGRASGGNGGGVDFDSDGHSKKKTKSKKSKSKNKTSKRGHYIHLADVYQVVNAG